MKITAADRIELHELMARYGDAVDDRAWDRLAGVFTADAVFDLPHLGVTLSGLDEIVRYMHHEGQHPLGHLMANVHVIADEHGVRLHSRALFPIPRREGGGNRVLHGSYYDDVAPTPDGWRVTHRLFSMQRLEKRGTPVDAVESPIQFPPDTDFSALPGVVDHIEQYRTDPDAAHDYDVSRHGVDDPVPALLLTTTGRRSGNPVVAPLIYGTVGDAFVVIGSKGGYPEHPHWYRNLLANPACTVQVRDRQFAARARTATGTERSRLWQMMTTVYPPYLTYQQATERIIPVVVLDEVAED